jgi:hypothetical protein
MTAPASASAPCRSRAGQRGLAHGRAHPRGEAADRQPRPYVGFNRWVHNYRDISMPLSEDNDTVNMIFGVLQFEV